MTAVTPLRPTATGPLQIVQANIDDWLADLFGLKVPGSRYLIDPWMFATLMGSVLSAADPKEHHAMRQWPLSRWTQAVDAEIDQRQARVRAEGGGPPPPPTPPAPPPGGGGGRGPLIPAPPSWLTESEREAWIQARTRAGEYARGLGNRLSSDAQNVVQEIWDGEDIVGPVDIRQRERFVDVIQQETADAVAHGRTARELASRLGRATGDWSRNLLRIARTELQGVHNEGVLLEAVRHKGEGALIARVPNADACPECKRVFLDEYGKPKIWTAAELVGNGTNVGRKANDWLGTLWPVHPNCNCGTLSVPNGFGFNDEWLLVPEAMAKAGPDVIKVGPRGGLITGHDSQGRPIYFQRPPLPVAELQAHTAVRGALDTGGLRQIATAIADRMGDGPRPGKSVEQFVKLPTGYHVVHVTASERPAGAYAQRSRGGGGHVMIEVLAGQPRAAYLPRLQTVLAHELGHAADERQEQAFREADRTGRKRSTTGMWGEAHSSHPAERAAIRSEAAAALDEPTVLEHGRYVMEHGTPWSPEPYTVEQAAAEMVAQMPNSTRRSVEGAGLLREVSAYAKHLLTKADKVFPRIIKVGPQGGKITGYDSKGKPVYWRTKYDHGSDLFGDKPNPAALDADIFASGVNNPGEVRGYASVGAGVGIAVDKILEAGAGPAVVAELKALRGTGTKVFVDSGAFNEVDTKLRVVAPITKVQWAERLALYEDLARHLGPQLYVVAPDQIGNQDVTLARLEEHRDALRRIGALGAQVMLPVQRGPRPPLAMWHAVVQAAGLPLSQVMPSMPANKGRHPVPDIMAFLRKLRPAALHLLGAGTTNATLRKVRDGVKRDGLDTIVRGDSVAIRSKAERDKSMREHLSEAHWKKYTNMWRPPVRIGSDALDLIDVELGQDIGGVAQPDAMDAGTDFAALEDQPNLYLSDKLRKTLAERFYQWRDERMPFTMADAKAFRRNPEKWLASPGPGGKPWGEHEYIKGAILMQWMAYYQDKLRVQERKRRQIQLTFGKAWAKAARRGGPYIGHMERTHGLVSPETEREFYLGKASARRGIIKIGKRGGKIVGYDSHGEPIYQRKDEPAAQFDLFGGEQAEKKTREQDEVGGKNWTPDLSVYDFIIINSSAGKDSEAQLDHLMTTADLQGVPRSKFIVVHADLGDVEWAGTKELAKRQADRYGLRFEVVRNAEGNLVEGIQKRFRVMLQRKHDTWRLDAAGIRTWRELAEAPEDAIVAAIGEVEGSPWDAANRARKMSLGAKRKVEKFDALSPERQEEATFDPSARVDYGGVIAIPGPTSRFCTADYKTRQVNNLISAMIEALPTYVRSRRGPLREGERQARVLSCLGIRADESEARTKMEPWQPASRKTKTLTRTRATDKWYPIFHWTTADVWDLIEARGLEYAPSYDVAIPGMKPGKNNDPRHPGMSRLSCMFCPFASHRDLTVSAMENKEAFKVYLGMEHQVGATFKQDSSLMDIAKELAEQHGQRVPEGTIPLQGMRIGRFTKALMKAMGQVHPAVTDAIGSLRAHGHKVLAVRWRWKTEGACVHVDTPEGSHHVAYVRYPEAYGHSLAALTEANVARVPWVEEGTPPTMLGKATQLDLFADKPVVKIGKRGGKITGHDKRGRPIYGGKTKRKAGPPHRDPTRWRGEPDQGRPKGPATVHDDIEYDPERIPDGWHKTVDSAPFDPERALSSIRALTVTSVRDGSGQLKSLKGGRELRKQFHRLLAGYGMTPKGEVRPDASLMLFVGSQYCEGFHGPDGRIGISDASFKGLRTERDPDYGGPGIAPGTRANKLSDKGEYIRLNVLLHEHIHHAGTQSSRAYNSGGAVIEEVATELACRWMMKEHWPGMKRPSKTPLAYERYITSVTEAVWDVLHKEGVFSAMDRAKEPMDAYRERMSRAAIRFKRHQMPQRSPMRTIQAFSEAVVAEYAPEIGRMYGGSEFAGTALEAVQRRMRRELMHYLNVDPSVSTVEKAREHGPDHRNMGRRGEGRRQDRGAGPGPVAPRRADRRPRRPAVFRGAIQQALRHREADRPIGAGRFQRVLKAQLDLFGTKPIIAIGKRGGKIVGYDAKGNPIYGTKVRRRKPKPPPPKIEQLDIFGIELEPDPPDEDVSTEPFKMAREDANLIRRMLGRIEGQERVVQLPPAPGEPPDSGEKIVTVNIAMGENIDLSDYVEWRDLRKMELTPNDKGEVELELIKRDRHGYNSGYVSVHFLGGRLMRIDGDRGIWWERPPDRDPVPDTPTEPVNYDAIPIWKELLDNAEDDLPNRIDRDGKMKLGDAATKWMFAEAREEFRKRGWPAPPMELQLKALRLPIHPEQGLPDWIDGRIKVTHDRTWGHKWTDPVVRLVQGKKRYTLSEWRKPSVAVKRHFGWRPGVGWTYSYRSDGYAPEVGMDLWVNPGGLWDRDAMHDAIDFWSHGVRNNKSVDTKAMRKAAATIRIQMEHLLRGYELYPARPGKSLSASLDDSHGTRAIRKDRSSWTSHHHWDGTVTLSQSCRESLVRADPGGLRTLIHECVHDVGKRGMLSYEGAGKGAEEVATEAIAQLVMRDHYGGDYKAWWAYQHETARFQKVLLDARTQDASRSVDDVIALSMRAITKGALAYKGDKRPGASTGKELHRRFAGHLADAAVEVGLIESTRRAYLMSQLIRAGIAARPGRTKHDKLHRPDIQREEP